MPKDTAKSDAIIYLRENGPSPKRDLPVESLGEQVRRRIGSLNISGGPDGGGPGGSLGGGTTNVAYLEEKHDFAEVVRIWTQLNSDALENQSPESFRRRLRNAVSRDRKDVVSEVLDDEGYSVDHSDRGHSYDQESDCPLCGSTMTDMASHLSECPEG